MLKLKFFNKQDDTPHVYQDIHLRGYTEIHNPYISKEFYQKLYNEFDVFIEHMSTQENLKKTIDQAEKDFCNIHQEQFCDAPTGYRDCTQKIGKKDQKIYFQFNEHLHSIIRNKYSHVFETFPFVKIFLDHLKYIDQQSRLLLSNAITELEKQIPNLKKILFGDRKNLTLILKILRYEGNGALCTSPHYDKSAITLGLNNSDKNEKFIIGPYMENLDLKKLSVPKRQYKDDRNGTSALLFPGACLQKIGLPLNPTPHAVLPSTTPYRYALITFCLVPNLDGKDVQTTIFDKHKALDVLAL